MLITISGLDGAGKSTLAHSLQQMLEKQNRRAVVIHMYYQMGTYAFLRRVRRWLTGGLAISSGSAKENSSPHQESNQLERLKVDALSLIRSIIWNKPFRRYVYLLDLIIFFVYRIYIETIKNQVLIMDRCFYDRLVDLSDGRGRLFNRLLALLTPTPSLPIYLAITPEEAYARKREQSVNYLKERWISYHMIFPQLRGSVVLAGNNNLNANLCALDRIVRERMVADENRRRNLVCILNSALAFPEYL